MPASIITYWLVCFYMAPRTRFELVIVESKSTVLPLHYQGTKKAIKFFKEQCVVYNRFDDLSTTLLFLRNQKKTSRTFVTRGL